MTEPDPQQPPDADLLAALPGLVRIAAAAWWRTAGWAAESSVRASSRVVRGALSGESPGELFAEIGGELRDYLRRLLDIAQPEPASPAAAPEPERPAPPQGARAPTLRERGAELLRQSADLDFDDDAHPAYERILDELAPDEGRILRLLAQEGPQPSIDVRTTGTLGTGIGSELVAPGLNMIGAESGSRHGDRVPAYLDNLHRLGLVWFSREPLEAQHRYHVLEAQPDAVAALERAGRGRTVRRSILLTPFGAQFCEACLPLHTAELDELPGGAPRDVPSPGDPPS
jgi:Abortive infection alpha